MAMSNADGVTVDSLPDGEMEHARGGLCPLSRSEWRAAWDRIRCPVVLEFFAHFTGPMTHKQGARFRRICRAVSVEKGTREDQWQRALFLADRAIRALAPVGLERCGRADLANELRAWRRLKQPWDFSEADRRFAATEHERASLAARDAIDYASRLGDTGAHRTVAGRACGGTAAGGAMQRAYAWDEGMDALLAVVKIRARGGV